MKVARAHMIAICSVLGFGGVAEMTNKELQDNVINLPDCRVEGKYQNQYELIMEAKRRNETIEVIGGEKTSKKQEPPTLVSLENSQPTSPSPEILQPTLTESPGDIAPAVSEPAIVESSATTKPSGKSKKKVAAKAKAKPKKEDQCKTKTSTNPSKKVSSPASKVSGKATGKRDIIPISASKPSKPTSKISKSPKTGRSVQKTTTKATKAKATGKGNLVGKRKTTKHTRPGIVAAIVQMLANGSRNKSLSKQNVVDALVKQFPGRARSAMACTTAQQVPHKLRKAGHTVRSDELGYWITQISPKMRAAIAA